MTAMTDFDRLVASWLEATDRTQIDGDTVTQALAMARRVPQRRGLRALVTGPAPWPASGPSVRGVPVALRVAVVVALLVAALVTSAVVGSRLLRSDPVLPPPTHLAVTDSSPTHTTPVAPPMPLLDGRPYGPSVVALPNGQVAILGGGATEVELWDPSAGRSQAAGAISNPRADVTAALLADGRILVVGGFDARDDQQTRLTTAEIYDPSTGASIATGAPGVHRMVCHCGTTFRDSTTIEVIPLLDGRLLVVGGASQSEIFDLGLNGFRTVAGGCDASRGAAARLRDGRVLVTCLEGYARTEQGVAGPGTNKAELFDPATGSFAPIGAPTTTDTGAATLLDDGRVLLTGEGLAHGTSPAEIFDPVTNTFAPVPGFNSNQPPLLLTDGRVMFSRYQELPSGILDPRTLTFASFAPGDPILQMGDIVSVALPAGRVLVVSHGDTRSLDVSQVHVGVGP